MNDPILLQKERTGSWLSANTAIAVLVIFYTIGIVGITLPVHPDFILLTPFNLLLSLGLVLAFHPVWNQKTAIFLFATYLAGFLAELFGTQTGMLFGSYIYGPVLGPQLWATPLMIGVNWVLLVYCTGVTVNHLGPGWPWPAKAALGAAVMVGLDVLIEPVAIRYDFWQWEQGGPPLRNYLGWYLVAYPLLGLFAVLQPGTRNKVAVALLVLQFFFFLILGIV